MVYGNLDPTILQSKTCKKMIHVIKSLVSSLASRKDSLTDDEIDMLKTARAMSKMHRNANAKIWGNLEMTEREEYQKRNEKR
jgi:hypothetical protein